MCDMKLLEDRTSTVLYNILDYIYMDMLNSNHSYRNFTLICKNEFGLSADEVKRFFNELNTERSGIFEDDTDFNECLKIVDEVYANCV